MTFPLCWHPWRCFWRIVWNVSEYFGTPLPNAHVVFGRCIGSTPYPVPTDCAGCEGEQFEGFICELCGRTADGKGGMYL